MQVPNTYDNERRFIFSNWSKDDFTGVWAGVATVVKSGEVRELPMYLAYHFTKHFVDREMTKDGKSSLLASEGERQKYEEKTIAEITAGTDSPALAVLKEQIRAEVAEANGGKAKTREVVTAPKESSTKEFADIK